MESIQSLMQRIFKQLKKRNKKFYELEQKIRDPANFSEDAINENKLTEVNYVIAHKLVKNNKPFSDGEFIKVCIVDATKLMSPEEAHKYEHLCLSRRTVVRRMKDISTHLCL